MAKFKGGKLIEEVLEALDKATAQIVTNTQSELSVSSPVDTGRLASSWFINKNSPSTKVPSLEPWASLKKGDAPVIKIEEYGNKITFGPDWTITSNLPYAKRAAYDPGYGGRRGGGRGDWYTAIENGLPDEIERIFTRALRNA